MTYQTLVSGQPECGPQAPPLPSPGLLLLGLGRLENSGQARARWGPRKEGRAAAVLSVDGSTCIGYLLYFRAQNSLVMCPWSKPGRVALLPLGNSWGFTLCGIPPSQPEEVTTTPLLSGPASALLIRDAFKD